MRYAVKFTQAGIIALLMAMSFSAAAQATIRGRVLDENGAPFIGATVAIKGTTLGTTSDFDGYYVLEDVEAGTQTVVASFLGYLTVENIVEVADGAETEVAFQLFEDSKLIEEVVVVGYGTQRKRDLVGSVAKVEAKDLNQTVGASFETALQGKAPGVQITQGSGMAGSSSLIRVRGVGSLTAGGDPLYVVDGIPIIQDQFLGENRFNNQNNPLSGINPNDIESISVLKDASAAAIYGSRGANGVIIITTKRGAKKKGRPEFNFNARVGTSDPTRVVDFLDSEELLQVRQEAWENDGNVGRAPLPSPLTSGGFDYAYLDSAKTNTDWFDEVLRTGIKQEYNLSMKQGGKYLTSYIGGSYTNSESYLVGNTLERASGRANFDISPLEKLKISLSTSLARTFTDRVDPLGSSLGLAQSSALPIYPIYDKEGNFFNVFQNPVAIEANRDFNTIELRSVNNANISILPTAGLSINLQGSYDLMNLNDYVFNDLLFGEQRDGIQYDRSERWETKGRNFNTYATATYDFNALLPEDHDLSVLVGSEYQATNYTGTYTKYLGLGEQIYRASSLEGDGIIKDGEVEYDIDKNRFFSIFSRINYDFRDKYFLQFVFRRDGSSKFGSNNRFGDFPSIGAGYVLTEEPFLKGNSIINFLKLKSSWGITGNAAIDWRSQFAIYDTLAAGQINSGFNYADYPARYINQIDNPNLKWEVGQIFDVGFEFGFFDDRLTGEFAYYTKRTEDVFISTALMASSGVNSSLRFLQNIGVIRNSGIEFSLNSRNLVGKFRWTTNFNIASNSNEVVSVGTATPDALAGGFGDTRAIAGAEVASNFLVPFYGIDAETGRPMYLDINGNPTFEYNVDRDRRAVGSGIPDAFGAITNTLEYKGFDLSFMFYYSIGGKIYDDAAKRQRGVITIEDAWNYAADVSDRWTSPGSDALYPQFTTTMLNWGGNANYWQNNHTLWLEDATFVRLRNLTLGYTIPLKSKFFRGARVYVTGTNLLTFTEYNGWDPEVARERSNAQERNIGGSSVTYLTPPQERSIMFGFNLDF